MENIVLYDSQFGHIQKIAKAIAGTIDGQAMHIQDFAPNMLEGISLIVVGHPIHEDDPSRPITEFLASLPSGSLHKKLVAVFYTRTKKQSIGSASKKIKKALVALGGQSVAPPAAFMLEGDGGPLAEGELKRAKDWAKHIMDDIVGSRDWFQ